MKVGKHKPDRQVLGGIQIEALLKEKGSVQPPAREEITFIKMDEIRSYKESKDPIRPDNIITIREIITNSKDIKQIYVS